jgi:hypothetical protein
VQTLVTLQIQLCIAASAKPKTAPTAALTFTNILSQFERALTVFVGSLQLERLCQVCLRNVQTTVSYVCLNA